MTDENFNKLIAESLPDQEAAFGMMDKLLDVAKPEAVYSEPVVADGVTVITASEYMGGLGVGFGGGFGSDTEGSEGESPASGAGGGGGAGGSILSRPVAAIIIEGGRVRVEPIVDVTKISIAFFTAFGAMWMALSRMRRASRR